MKRCVLVSAAMVTAGAATGMALPSATGATQRQESAAGCHAALGEWPSNAALTHFGLMNTSSQPYLLSIFCSLADDTVDSKANASAVNLNVFDASSATKVTGKLCVDFTTTDGGECGSAKSTTDAAVGDQALYFSTAAERAAWTANNSSFGYVFASVPQFSAFQGYKTFY